MTVPAYHDARNDVDLVGPPLFVYLYLLHEVLDPVEYRPVKQEALAAHFKYHLNTIEQIIKRLRDSRYIERGPVKPGAPRTYRLVYSRVP